MAAWIKYVREKWMTAQSIRHMPVPPDQSSGEEILSSTSHSLRSRYFHTSMGEKEVTSPKSAYFLDRLPGPATV